MPKKNESLRGGDTSTPPQVINSCHIPAAVISRLEREMEGLEFGGVSLVIAIRNGHPTFRIEKTLSFMAGD